MKNDYDGEWHSAKEAIAMDKKDITAVWKCTTTNRKKAHDKHIYSYYDHRCTAKNLGITGDSSPHTVDAILNINRGKKNISGITEEVYEKLNSKKLQFYIDFETINGAILDDFSTFPQSNSHEYIFQIGVGVEVAGWWKYKSFTVDFISENEERRICELFIHYITYMRIVYSKEETYRIYHWSNAEQTLWNKTMHKHYNYFYEIYKGLPLLEPLAEWVDLLKIFKDETIVVKGAFNFGLKSIATAMYKHKMINTKWDTVCTDGSTAMLFVKLANDKVHANILSSIKQDYLVEDIKKYNECDCKTIYEIVKYIKSCFEHFD